MRIVNGMVFDGQCFRERDVVVEGDRFARVEPAGATGSAGARGRAGLLCDSRPD